MNPGIELLQKYNLPVPRYTSYPPANHFSTGFTASNYRNALLESNHLLPSNISIYIHIPFCKTKCWYCGCNSCPMAEDIIVRKYFDSLKKEISLVKSLLDTDRLVSQVHYGGGTPNSVPLHYISNLNEYLFDVFRFIDEPEIAIECHPAFLDMEYIRGLNDAGFNRFSIGVQDFNPKVLAAVKRLPPSIPLEEIIRIIKSQNHKAGINLDLMYGLPYQTPESFREAVIQATALRPERITTFPYAHVPWVNSLQKKLEDYGLPDTLSRFGMLAKAREVFTTNEYSKVAMDHYTLSNDELALALSAGDLHRNFQGYCTRRTTGQVYAFGVTGISQLQQAYAQNVKEPEEYMHLIENGRFATGKGYRLNEDEIKIRTVINNLMCNKSLNWEKTAGTLDIKPDPLKRLVKYDQKKIDEMEDDGLIISSRQEIKVTETGEPFLRVIASALDPAYILSKGKYSNVI